MVSQSGKDVFEINRDSAGIPEATLYATTNPEEARDRILAAREKAVPERKRTD